MWILHVQHTTAATLVKSRPSATPADARFPGVREAGEGTCGPVVHLPTRPEPAKLVPMAKLLIALGMVLILIGLAVGYAPWLFSWFGKLPGDIRIERENGVFLFPLTSMLLVSVVLSLLLSLFFRR